MRQLLLALVFVPLLSACPGGFLPTVHKHSAEEMRTDPVLATRKLIDEANALLTTGYRAAMKARANGGITKAKYDSYIADLDLGSSYADQSAALLGGGSLPAAQRQLKLATDIANFIQRELIMYIDQKMKEKK